MPERKTILFVCIGNACRSPMAEGFARFHGRDIIEVRSAGLYPYGQICEETVMVMRERGIDISGQRSKGLATYDLGDFDLIISMIPPTLIDPDNELPVRYWEVHDPFRQPIPEFRLVRDNIECRVLELLDQLCQGLPL